MYVDVIENNYSKEAHIQNFQSMFNELGRFMGILGKKTDIFYFVGQKALVGLYIENKVQYVEDCKS